MNSKPLGKSGETIPEIGLGTSRYRGGVEPLHEGISLGAFIDTAEMYRTEDVVGMAVQGSRESTFIATKVLSRNLKYSDLMQAAERSLRLLQTDYIDLYQLHHPNASVPIAETMRAMEDLVDQGKVRFIGVSNYSVSQLAEAMKAMTRHEIVSNQVRYSLTHRNVEGDLLPFCQQNQITVIAHTPLDGGGLAAKSFLRRRQASDILQKVADETGRTVSQVALNWCLSRPNVVVIPKSDKTDRVVENCGASGWSLTPQQVHSLEEAFK
jgi:diketogulonate reductase-like aldo/keto reductase